MECFSDLGIHSDVFVAILATLQDSATSTFELEELNEEDAANKSSRERVPTCEDAAHVLCVNSANIVSVSLFLQNIISSSSRICPGLNENKTTGHKLYCELEEVSNDTFSVNFPL